MVAEAPVVDTQSNEVGTNYDREWVENAPLRRYSFFDLVASAPGSLQGGDGSDAHDGLRLRPTTRTPSRSTAWTSPTTSSTRRSAEPNTDAIEEVEVLSLGAPAEYGNLTGAVYNIVTRQGTNEFHGDLNFFCQSDGLTSNNTRRPDQPRRQLHQRLRGRRRRRCPWTRDKYRDFTAQLGGPDRQGQAVVLRLLPVPARLTTGTSASTHGPTACRSSAITTDRYFGKLNWQINPKHKLVGNFHLDDKQRRTTASDIGSAPTTAWTRRGKTPTPGLAYTGVLSDKTVVDVRYSGFYGDVTRLPHRSQPAARPAPLLRPRHRPHPGGHYYWYELEPQRTTATAKVSHLADDFLGAEPRLPLRRAVQRRGGPRASTATTTSSTPTA